MRYFYLFVIAFALVTGCKPKVISGVELENKLKETMANYLHETLQPGVQVSVKDVTYFAQPEDKNYLCHFNVEMRMNNKDTTGVVVATISNDFKQVERRQ
jgi:hypothetical protein